MAYEPKEGSGALFKNDKGDNKARPDYRGNVMVGGVEYELSSWIKEGAKGKWMSLSAKPKDGGKAPSKSAPKPAQANGHEGGGFDPMDDVPFSPLRRNEG